MLITSRTNTKIIFASSLTSKKKRDESGLFLIEGAKLFCEAVKRKTDIAEVFVTEKAFEKLEDILSELSCPVYTVTESVYDKLTMDKSPDGVICTAHELKSDSKCKPKKPFIICDMQDAGNLGTCIRTALALGISPLILAGECADIYNPKTVRASMGALFSQSILTFDTHKEAIEYCRNNGFCVFAAALKDYAKSIYDVPKENSVFAVGNEGHGLPEETIEMCDGCAIIPMQGDSESLNASVASALLMWESTKNS